MSDFVQHDHAPETMHGLPIIGMPWLKPAPFPLACYDCFLRYGEPGWMDAHVPDEVWARISPTGNGGGILCITCMARRCLALNIECRIQLGSGPFTLGPEAEMRELEWRREQMEHNWPRNQFGSLVTKGEWAALAGTPTSTVLGKWTDPAWREWAKIHSPDQYEIESLRAALGTEQAMHAAWRKRAEEAEALAGTAPASEKLREAMEEVLVCHEREAKFPGEGLVSTEEDEARTCECELCAEYRAVLAVAAQEHADYASGLRYALSVLDEPYSRDEAVALIRARYEQFSKLAVAAPADPDEETRLYSEAMGLVARIDPLSYKGGATLVERLRYIADRSWADLAAKARADWSRANEFRAAPAAPAPESSQWPA